MKPIVHYQPVGEIVLGQSACVIPFDHPGNENDWDVWNRVVNHAPVHTSRVIGHDYETGEFETLNTIYRLVAA